MCLKCGMLINCQIKNGVDRLQWVFSYNKKPIPDRRHDYEATHVDYDGDGDKRAFTGESVEDLENQIKEWEEGQ